MITARHVYLILLGLYKYVDQVALHILSLYGIYSVHTAVQIVTTVRYVQ